MALASARGLIRWASLRQLEETACSTAAVISRGLATSPAAAAALGGLSIIERFRIAAWTWMHRLPRHRTGNPHTPSLAP